MPTTQSTATRQLKGSLDSTSIVKVDGGYSIVQPPVLGLALSGGGAKGVAYAGMIKEMEHQGKLKELTHLSGASAGAMTASLIAIGMSADDMEKVITKLNMSNLIKTSLNPVKVARKGRDKGENFTNVLELIYMYQISKHLETIQNDPSKRISNSKQRRRAREKLNKLKEKVKNYQEAIKDLNINGIEDIIKLTKDKDKLKDLNNALKARPSIINDENKSITFNDLRIASY